MKAMFLAKNNFRLTPEAAGTPSQGASKNGTQSTSLGVVGDVANLVSILRGFSTVYTSPVHYGQCIEAGIKAQELSLLKKTAGNLYIRNIGYMVRQCLDHGVDVFITAGGDGTASYVASSVIQQSIIQQSGIRQDLGRDKHPLFLGFPAGTANAGPIVHPLHTGDLKDMEEVPLDAIEVTDGDKVIGYGFNDVVIGNSFLGTLDDRLVNLDAATMALYGKKEVIKPGERIAGKDFTVKLSGKESQIPHGIAQICVSTVGLIPLGPRAVLGGLLNSEGDDHPAAAAFISRNMIDSDPSSWNWRGPVTTTHICFTEKEVLEISGLGEDAQVIVDGNPFVRKTDKLSFRIVPQACTALWDTGRKGR